MKKILITGKNSFVGNSFAEWTEQYPDQYKIDKISLRNNAWKEVDFSKYDVVLHVAGIAHRKETKENAKLYYQVNTDLAFKVAEKAKNDGVNYFVFLSSMSVYGMETGEITIDTIPNPKTNYGKSKLQAEEKIKMLEDSSFKLAVLRPPMIYGKNCKGNYPRLAKIAIKSPIFPKVDNKRSMIYVGNLSEFIRVLIDKEKTGLFFPQNSDYVNTSELVELISLEHDKKIILTKLFNPIIKILGGINVVNKVFGDLFYTNDLTNSHKVQVTRFIDLKKSIKLTEE
ncbi:NAD-dependent epimerase/dehydratase family protein [Virgibacillus dokdonensis]|uniref:UDP-galactose-4-epimerase n=1 Tax=Virgibacillus dokdonensis TaxID=302167 RepID=A0A2K9IV83_9BACI|nr:NAD-dependent epimerase/dehydratase family protein [Virgibacillus dokdonensis]AUJ23657.1 UDP-galactose-4-epimerase [Virgibacillus dokdonensis]